MVKFGDVIYVIRDSKADMMSAANESIVLGSESDFMWLFGIASREIYRSNPECVLDHQGRKVLFDLDYRQSIDEVFDEKGNVASTVFWHASEALRIQMTNYLKVLKLIDTSAPPSAY